MKYQISVRKQLWKEPYMVRPCQTSLRAVWFGRPTNLLVKRCSVKSGNKELVKTKITTYFVTHLGIAAAQNSLMTYRRLDWVPPPGSIKLNHNTQCEIVKPTLEISLWKVLYSIKATQSRALWNSQSCLVGKNTPRIWKPLYLWTQKQDWFWEDIRR